MTKRLHNVLHQNGFGEVVVMEILFSFSIGLLIAVMAFKHKANFQSGVLYIFTIIACVGLVIAPVAIFAMAFIKVMFFGVTLCNVSGPM